MFDQSSRKYLLLAALSLVVIGDVYFGRDVSGTGQGSGTPAEAIPLPSSTPPATKPQAASLAFPAVEFAATAASVEKIPRAETSSAGSENLSTTLKSIDADYDAMARPILEQSAPVIAPEDREKLTLLDQEKLVDLGKVLTTEELEFYQNAADPATAPRRR